MSAPTPDFITALLIVIVVLIVYAIRTRWRLHKQAAASREAQASRDAAIAASNRDRTERDIAVGERNRALAQASNANTERDRALRAQQVAEHEMAAALTERDGAVKSLEASRNDVEDLRAALDRLVNLDERIRNDLPKRLEGLTKFITETMPESVDRDHALRDLYTVIERVRLHLASDIQAHVTHGRIEGAGIEGDGESLVGLVQWIGKMYSFESRMSVVGSATIGIMHKRIFWDLMITNVLSNAVYHAGAAGRVEVRITKQPDGNGRVDISNEGPHIPKAEIGRVFNLGYSTKKGGRGLGLYVAQEIAHGLGGRILPPENEELGWVPFARKKRVTFSIVDLPIVDLAEIVEA